MDCFEDWEIGETPDMVATAFSGFANDIDRRGNGNGLNHAHFYAAGKRHGLGQPRASFSPMGCACHAHIRRDLLVRSVFVGTCVSGPSFNVRLSIVFRRGLKSRAKSGAKAPHSMECGDSSPLFGEGFSLHNLPRMARR